MSVFLSFLETFMTTTALPVAGICLTMALLDSLGSGLSLRSLTTLIKRTYTFGVSLFMLLLCGVLGLQSTLCKGADTLALRTVRFAVGSFLPMVGGSVAESLRTVAGSVGYLRGTVGMGGILVLFFAFLPLFLSILFTRAAFLLGGAAAGMLSCPREERLLGELASVFGYFMAIIACLFVTVAFSLTLLAHCAAAV
jgi:stage III sporulation protein AE